MVRRSVACVACIAALLGLGGCTPFEDGPRTVTAWFEDTPGLFVGNDVGVLGVPVGEVVAIEPRGEQVEVTLEVARNQPLPDHVGAVVVARSLATDRYVELTPVYSGGETLADGEEIPIERTRTPVEWDEILASLDKFTNGLAGQDKDAGALRRVLDSGARALGGRGRAFNQTLSQVAVAASALSEHRGDITGSIENLAALTKVLADNRGVIDQFITSVTDATDLFADERVRLGRTLRSLSSALGSLADFVRANRGALRTNLTGLTDVTDSLLEHQEELAEAVEVLPVMLDNISRTVVDGRMNTKVPSKNFLPSDALAEALCSSLPADLCDQIGTSPDLDDLLSDLLGGGQ